MLLTLLPGIAVLDWAAVILVGAKHEEKRYEGRINHRSAIRCYLVRDSTGLTASHITGCCA